MTEVAVIGGGVVGTAVALALARRDESVVLHEARDELAGAVEHPTLSHHHQGVDRIGDGFEISGWSDDDDVPEAIEDPRLRFALGVQWHPEVDPDSHLIEALVAEAAAARNGAGR